MRCGTTNKTELSGAEAGTKAWLILTMSDRSIIITPCQSAEGKQNWKNPNPNPISNKVVQDFEMMEKMDF